MLSSARYAGMDYEKQVFNGSALLKDTITTPWSSTATATHKLDGLPSQQAYHTGTATTRVYTPLASGAVQQTRTDNTLDDLGRITRTDDQGNTAADTDDICTTTAYASGAGILTRADEVTTVAGRCSPTPSLPAHAISDVRTYYDGSTTLGTIPTSADPTRTDTATSYTGSTPVFTTATATYDQYGRSLTATDALNNTSRNTYTPTTGANPSSTSTTDPLSMATKATFDQARGLVLTTTDPASYVTSEQYDTLGRATSVYKPGSTAGKPTLRFAYHLSNTAPGTIETYGLAADGQTYLDTEVLYDSMLRPRETQTQTADGGRTISDVMYNTDGLKSEDAGPYYNSSAVGRTLQQASAGVAGPETGYEYDQAGRLVSEDAYLNATPTWQTTHTYGGNFVTTVPPAGGTATTTVTDARGQTTDSIKYHAGVPVDYLRDTAADYDDTHYTYYPTGKQHTMTDAAGNTWSWAYDLTGDVTEADDPDSGKTTYSYDADLHVTTVTDARNKQVTTAYDHDGRKTGLWDTTSTSTLSGSNQLAAWTYDKATVAGTSVVAKGLPYSATSYSGGDVYTTKIAKYNAFGSVDTRTDTLTGADAALAPAAGYTTYYRYTAAGAPSELWDPAAGGLGQETISYGHKTGDPTSRITSLSSNMWNYVSAAGYSEFGQPLQYTMPTVGGTIWQTLKYDDQTHNLIDQSVTDSSTSGLVDDLSYGYGSATVSKGTGLITKIVDSRNAGATVDIQCYTYDYATRLSQAWSANDGCAAKPTDNNRSTVGGPVSPYWQSWTYDAAGNRSTQTDHGLVDASSDKTTTYTYPAAGSTQPHKLTGAGGATYSYDTDGNTTTVVGGPNGNQALNWNTLSKLDTATGTAGTTQYVYDADGNLVVRRDPGTATLYLGDTQVVLNRSSNATSATRYYSVNGTTIASRTSTNTLTYLLADRQGTTQTSLDATTQSVTRRNYLPFGQVRGSAPSTWSGDLGFHAGTNDTITGYENLGAREYDPSTGRFLSVDPVLDAADPQQLNGYDYADNDPVTLSDPGGTDPCSTGGDGCSYQGANGTFYPTAEEAASLGGTLPTANGPTGGKSVEQTHDLSTTHNPDNSLDIETFHIDPVNITDADQFAKLVRGYYYDNPTNETKDNTLRLLDAMARACQTPSHDGVCSAPFAGELVDALVVRNKHDHGCDDACVEDYEHKVTSLRGLVLTALLMHAEGGAQTAAAASISLTEDDVLAAAGGTSMMCAGRESFTPDTPVKTANGATKPINHIKVGDKVLATDPVTGQTSAREVTAVSIHHDNDLADLLVSDPAGHLSTLHTTIAHPFWDRTKRAWVEAGRLDHGDHLQDLLGADLTVAAVIPMLGAQDMYNLTIADVHTYYVLAGTTPVLVHNACGDPPPNLSPAGAGRSGAFNQAKRDSGIPTSQSPDRTLPNVDRRGNVQPGTIYKFDVPAPGGGTRTIRIRDDAGGHIFPDDPSQNRGPHFNTENGDHYDY